MCARLTGLSPLGSKKYGRNSRKCARYRARVGKPNGPGMAGNRNH